MGTDDLTGRTWVEGGATLSDLERRRVGTLVDALIVCLKRRLPRELELVALDVELVRIAGASNTPATTGHRAGQERA